MFCKLFGPPEDQILVMIGTDDEGDPCLTTIFQPKDCGVCQVKFSYENSDDGFDTLDKALEDMTEAKARIIIDNILKH